MIVVYRLMLTICLTLLLALVVTKKADSGEMVGKRFVMLHANIILHSSFVITKRIAF